MGRKLSEIIAHPGQSLERARAKLAAVFTPKEFVADAEHRSDSENGRYVASVMRAVGSYKHFSRFKRDPHYRKILEHVSHDQGQAYLDVLQKRDPALLDRALQTVLRSDKVGSPIKSDYGALGPLSPTTLRYVKVASDLKQLFGETIGADIAEIGCGYGGQCNVLDTLFEVEEFHLFDLPVVNELIAKYLESYVMRAAYQTCTLNSAQPRPYDLVISNYAFSELPKHIEMAYIRKVLAKAKRGYLTMNSGKGGDRDRGKLTLDELRAVLPPFDIFDEQPLTSRYNYIIVWGHTAGATL